MVELSSKWRLPLNLLKCDYSFCVRLNRCDSPKPLPIFFYSIRFLIPHLTFHSFIVTFDQTLSFKHHVLCLQKKIYNQFRAFGSIVSASRGPFKEFFCTLYKAFFRLIFTNAFPGWFCFLSSTHITSMEKMKSDPLVELSQNVFICSHSSPSPRKFLSPLM